MKRWRSVAAPNRVNAASYPVIEIQNPAEARMFDLPYILTHPLMASIYKRHAELVDLAKGLAAGSEDRKAIERRISILEQYRLPKPLPEEQKTATIMSASGGIICEESSLRRRLKAVHRGRPEEFRIKVRAALEQKIAHPERTWPELAERFVFTNYKDLERQVRLLKKVLRDEGIAIPTAADYRSAQDAFDQCLEKLRPAAPPE